MHMFDSLGIADMKERIITNVNIAMSDLDDADDEDDAAAVLEWLGDELHMMSEDCSTGDYDD